MRHTKAELYVHVIWATEERCALIKIPQRRPLYRCLEDQAAHLDCAVLAIGGMPDHVHMALRMPTKLAVAKMMQHLKGISSKFATDQLALPLFR
jgi:putative transposase